MAQIVLGLVITTVVWANNLGDATKLQGAYNDNFLHAKYIPNTQVAYRVVTERELIWRPVIEKYASLYGADIKAMIAVARCESNFNPLAFNASDPNGGSRGVYQYQISTFYNNAWFDKPDIWNAEQQIELTAFLFSKGKAGLWACYWKYIGQPVPWQ